MKTKQIDTHDVKAGDVIMNAGYAFEVAETFFFEYEGREVFRYRVARCLNNLIPYLTNETLPATYTHDAVYGHNADMLVTVLEVEVVAQ